MALKDGKAMGPDGIPGRRRGRYVIGSVTQDFQAGENARGMEGQCDCTNLRRR